MSDRAASPPNLALETLWLSIPSESTMAFRESFSLASRAIQLALREYLPARWFSDPAHYWDRDRSLPMLAYQCSRPASFRQGRDYTYDLLNAATTRNLFWSIRQRLPGELARLEASGRLAWEPALAKMYSPRRAPLMIQFVREHRRLLNRILASETRLVNALVLFAVAVPGARSPVRVRERLMRSWRGTLSRIYPEIDASPFCEELLARAKAAVNQAQIASEFPLERPTISA